MKALSVALAGAFLLSGCAGYQLGPAKPGALKTVHTIAVQNLRNNTFLPRVDTLVTSSIIKQIQQDGTYQITTADKADAILEGTINGVSRAPARSVKGNVLATTEFNLNLSVGWTMKTRAGAVIAGPGVAVGSTSFFVGADVATDERQALPLAAEDLAVRLVSQISEGW